jgi:hypothetical protein
MGLSFYGTLPLLINQRIFSNALFIRIDIMTAPFAMNFQIKGIFYYANSHFTSQKT